MKKPKVRELGEALKALLTRPYTSKFPKIIPEPVDGFRGKPEFQGTDCVGCGACSEVCPAQAIELIDDKEKKRRFLTLHLDHCIFCGQCELNCITEKGIILTKEYDLTTLNRDDLTEKIDKELTLCELCGTVIGTTEHIKWLAEQLGSSAYTNPTVMLVSMRELGIIDAASSPDPENPVRADRMKILCPGCRKTTTLNP